MSCWRRPKFWLLLIVGQLAAFLLSAMITTAIFLGFSIAGVSHHLRAFNYCMGIPLNAYLAWDAFRWVRGRFQRLPQPRGFPVILTTSDSRRGSPSSNGGNCLPPALDLSKDEESR